MSDQINPFTIRTGTLADVPHLANIESAADMLFPSGRLPPDGGTYAAEDFHRAIEHGLLEIAWVAQQQAGFAVAQPDENNLHLALLAVHPEHGRRGIGRALVSHVLQMAVGAGYRQVTLTTFADIPWNAPFYRSMGFIELAAHAQTERVQQILAAEIDTGMYNRVAMAFVSADGEF
ncbi:MAG: GNAT family N-acetyltransferase [Pseudomonadota bacterium]